MRTADRFSCAGEDSDQPVVFMITPLLRPMHPLELFDRFRRWFGWVAPGRQLWERNPEQVAPDRSDDWLLEPPSLEEARLLFPQLDEERALLRYQQLRLEMRERDGRGF